MRRTQGVAIGLVIGLAALGWLVWWVLQPGADPTEEAWSLQASLREEADSGFLRATSVREFSFPADYGPHPGYKTEWWYYTGNLSSADGRQWGYELTFFRQVLSPVVTERSSAWATNDLYLAHFTLTDIAGREFYTAEQLVRGDSLGLGGATAEPFRVWVDSWSASGSGPQAHLEAHSADVAIALDVSALKPPILQGDRGLSPKNSQGDSASYYFSLTRMATTGTITIANQPVEVSGLTWFDREWSSGVLGSDQAGWAWFGLHLDDGRDLMVFNLRRLDGSTDYSAGSLISAGDLSGAETTRLSAADLRLTEQRWWTNPNGVRYPIEWRIEVPSQQIDITVAPLLDEQELRLRSAQYWEGAMRIAGTQSGSGYLEMTGYEPLPGQP